MFKCSGKVPEALLGLRGSGIGSPFEAGFGRAKEGGVSPWVLLGSLAFRGHLVPPEVTCAVGSLRLCCGAGYQEVEQVDSEMVTDSY